MIAVSHDRYFLRRIATRIVTVEGGKLVDYQGDYEVRRQLAVAFCSHVVGIIVLCMLVYTPAYACQTARCLAGASSVALLARGEVDSLISYATTSPNDLTSAIGLGCTPFLGPSHLAALLGAERGRGGEDGGEGREGTGD